jgi:hypothetical protein
VIVLVQKSATIELDGSATSIHTHAWNSARSVLDFLGHVYGAVDSLPNTDQQETPTIVPPSEQLTIKAAEAAIWPTIQAPPIVDQPPKFSNLPNTSPTEALGASTQSGIIMTKKPMMNMTRMITSKTGKCLVAKTLKEMAKAPTAMVISVPCLGENGKLDAARSPVKVVVGKTKKPDQAVPFFFSFTHHTVGT